MTHLFLYTKNIKTAAVLIGINYLDTPDAVLNGCINDVNNMKVFLQQQGFNNIKVFTDDTKKRKDWDYIKWYS